jgi:3-phosphoinositide dependent protein kinase-1
VKLIDFGTAKLLRHPIKLQSDEKQDNKGDRRGKFKEFVGTPEYMSPEAINNKNTDQRADLWSFGAFIAQIVTGMPPFKGGSDYLTFKRVLARKFRLPEGTPPHAASLIEALCVLEPTERLGGKWTEAADAVEPTSISGMEGRELGGHAAIRAHPLFAAYPMLDLHRVPCPTMTEEECALSDQVKLIDEIRQKEGGGGVRALGEEAAIQRAVVESWSDEWRMAVAFECGKRDLLGDEMRELLKMGPALPPLTDDLEEFATDDAEEGAAEEEAVDEDEDHEAAELREAEEERQAAASAAARGSRTLPKAEDDALGEGGVVV